MFPLIFVVALLGAQQPPASEMGEDIVVTATPRGGCVTKLADATLTDQEFNRHARAWAAGLRVRVIARADADIKCLSRIAFQLADRGVHAIEFVDPRGRAPMPIRGLPTRDPASGSSGGNSTGESDMVERERRFNATRAAKLILQGKCAEARDLVLGGGDLAAAADVVQICRAQ